MTFLDAYEDFRAGSGSSEHIELPCTLAKCHTNADVGIPCGGEEGIECGYAKELG